jgi:hypothetical protein
MATQEWTFLNEENRYKIYNNGDIYDCIKERIAKPYFNTKQHVFAINIYINSKVKIFTVHTLIYTMFNNPIKKGHYITHLDNNYKNNHITNLAMISRRENKEKIYFDLTIWKQIPGYEDRYIINRESDIKSLVTNKILEVNYDITIKNGYKNVKLTDKDGKRKGWNIHILVYISFIGPKNNDLVIDHINQNRLDNNLSNLREVTRSENSKNCIRQLKSNINVKILCNNFIFINNKFRNYDLSKYSINQYGQIRNTYGKILTAFNIKN